MTSTFSTNFPTNTWRFDPIRSTNPKVHQHTYTVPTIMKRYNHNHITRWVIPARKLWTYATITHSTINQLVTLIWRIYHQWFTLYAIANYLMTNNNNNNNRQSVHVHDADVLSTLNLLFLLVIIVALHFAYAAS